MFCPFYETIARVMWNLMGVLYQGSLSMWKFPSMQLNVQAFKIITVCTGQACRNFTAEFLESLSFPWYLCTAEKVALELSKQHYTACSLQPLLHIPELWVQSALAEASLKIQQEQMVSSDMGSKEIFTLYPADQVECLVASQGRVIREKLELLLTLLLSECDSVSSAWPSLLLRLSHWWSHG